MGERCALLGAALVLAVTLPDPGEATLRAEMGRNEIRVYSQAPRIRVGDSVTRVALPERLELRGYRRVHQRPRLEGEYFWGYDNFWVFRRRFVDGRKAKAARLVQLQLERESGDVTAVLVHSAGRPPVPENALDLEPMLLAESLDEERAVREPVSLDSVPAWVWQAVLAIEDARFFSHGGVDPRSVARAMLKNALAGKVTQGGSTITQQLVKIRDLSPRRTLGRKVSEAVRALAIEAEYDKREILAAYLDSVYMGHHEGVAVYGIGAAARCLFSKDASRLDLGQAALLAGMIQGPNRLDPRRHPERALARQRAVLARLEELGWVERGEIRRELARGLPPLKLSPPAPGLDRQMLAWISEEIAREAPRRKARGRGFLIRTSLDPLLQRAAEDAVEAGLARLRREEPRLRDRPLSGVLVALDGRTGGVLASVSGDPASRRDAFDRVRNARRQPGSAIKPIVLLEALESCGSKRPLDPARRIADVPLEIALESGTWSPTNADGRFRGDVTIRQATIESLNVPFVRIARHCGFGAIAERVRKSGVQLPAAAPPSFVLGAVEVSPLEMATAYTVFTTPGRRLEPQLIASLRTPSGRRLLRSRVEDQRVVSPATAFVVRNLLARAVEEGTGGSARLGERRAFGKTGTSSGGRDAWFVGISGPVVAAVWVGLDSGEPLGATGSRVAAPIWREFMRAAAVRDGDAHVEPPRGVVERWVEDRSGLRVPEPGPGRSLYLFKRGSEPPRKRPWRSDPRGTIE